MPSRALQRILGGVDVVVPSRALQRILGGVDVVELGIRIHGAELGARDLGADLLGAEDTATRRTADYGVRLLHAPPSLGRVAGFAT